jgi:hypothetical protein
METSNELWLLKLQSAEGTAETSLVDSDFVECDAGSKIDEDIQTTEINLLGQGMQQDYASVGRKKANFTMVFPLRRFSDTKEKPDWVKALQIAGFAVGSHNGYWVCRPSSTLRKSGTIWHYSGDPNPSASIVTKIGNAKADWKIELPFSGDNYGKVTLTGVGSLVSIPALATQPIVDKDRSLVPGLTGVTMQINGVSTYQCTNLEFSGNQGIESMVKPTDTSGVGISRIKGRKIKFSCKAYTEVPATIDPMTALYNSTVGLSNVYWGTGSMLKIDAQNTQITKCARGEENGITVWDIEGLVGGNAFTIKCDGGNSSSSSSSSSH